MNERSPTLVVRNLSAWYDNGEAKEEIFSRVSFDIAPGEIVGVFGRNGSGKSTLLRAIARLHRPISGEISLPQDNTNRGGISFLPQSYINSFFGWASLRWNILIATEGPWGRRRELIRRIEAIKTELGLSLDLRLRPMQSSGGMIQQAAIIRALANEPKLLIADEPFSALDVEIARSVRRSFRQTIHRRRIAALVVMHDFESIIDISDRVLVVPGRPYSSEIIPGYARVEIMANRYASRTWDTTDAPGGRGRSFVDIMRETLELKNDQAAK